MVLLLLLLFLFQLLLMLLLLMGHWRQKLLHEVFVDDHLQAHRHRQLLRDVVAMLPTRVQVDCNFGAAICLCINRVVLFVMVVDVVVYFFPWWWSIPLSVVVMVVDVVVLFVMVVDVDMVVCDGENTCRNNASPAEVRFCLISLSVVMMAMVVVVAMVMGQRTASDSQEAMLQRVQAECEQSSAAGHLSVYQNAGMACFGRPKVCEKKRRLCAVCSPGLLSVCLRQKRGRSISENPAASRYTRHG
jgi:hypothetical protein